MEKRGAAVLSSWTKTRRKSSTITPDAFRELHRRQSAESRQKASGEVKAEVPSLRCQLASWWSQQDLDSSHGRGVVDTFRMSSPDDTSAKPWDDDEEFLYELCCVGENQAKIQELVDGGTLANFKCPRVSQQGRGRSHAEEE